MIQQLHSWVYIQKKKKNSNLKKYMHPNVLSSTFITAKTWKQLKCPLTDDLLKKIWYIYNHIWVMEGYSAIRKNEILSFAATWLDLENIMLFDVSQKEKTNTIWYHLYVEYEK